MSSTGNVYTGGLRYIESIQEFISNYDLWIEIPLQEFIDALGDISRSRRTEPARAENASFSLVQRPGAWTLLSGKRQMLQFTFYGFDGRVLFSRSSVCRSGQVIPLFDCGTVSPGIRLVRVSNGTEENVFRITAW